ncbi:MAG: uroporphyrinogen-III C-methyltransferase [Candidatus Methylomirabilales bacterium]
MGEEAMVEFLLAFFSGVVVGLSCWKLRRRGSEFRQRLAEWIGHSEQGRERLHAGNGLGLPFRRRRDTSTEGENPSRLPTRESGLFWLGELGHRTSNGRGQVSLVGAGPGEPGLLTLKGKRCLEEADVVVYDYLVNDCLLASCRPEAERIHVGKPGSDQRLSQEEINRLLIDRAREGKAVVRLKGGDPFIFSRGGEEAEAFAEAGISFEVVPGVTSATAVPSYAGIPLTHRNLASTVAFVTGHENLAKQASGIDWKAVAGMGTVVFLMGVGRLSQIAARLVEEGRDPETPVAVIQWGTWPRQQTVTGTLQDIREKAGGMGSPGVIVVGEVVRLRDRLGWFEEAVFSRRTVVTGAREQQTALPS